MLYSECQVKEGVLDVDVGEHQGIDVYHVVKHHRQCDGGNERTDIEEINDQKNDSF